MKKKIKKLNGELKKLLFVLNKTIKKIITPCYRHRTVILTVAIFVLLSFYVSEGNCSNEKKLECDNFINYEKEEDNLISDNQIDESEFIYMHLIEPEGREIEYGGTNKLSFLNYDDFDISYYIEDNELFVSVSKDNSSYLLKKIAIENPQILFNAYQGCSADEGVIMVVTREGELYVLDLYSVLKGFVYNSLEKALYNFEKVNLPSKVFKTGIKDCTGPHATCYNNSGIVQLDTGENLIIYGTEIEKDESGVTKFKWNYKKLSDVICPFLVLWEATEEFKLYVNEDLTIQISENFEAWYEVDDPTKIDSYLLDESGEKILYKHHFYTDESQIFYLIDQRNNLYELTSLTYNYFKKGLVPISDKKVYGYEITKIRNADPDHYRKKYKIIFFDGTTMDIKL